MYLGILDQRLNRWSNFDMTVVTITMRNEHLYAIDGLIGGQNKWKTLACIGWFGLTKCFL